MSTLTTAVVLVDCSTREHADLRPDDCVACGGTHLRPARDAEVVYCSHGHEAELILTDQGPELDSWAPDLEEGPWPGHSGGTVLWWCRRGHCDDSIILQTRSAA